MKHLHTFVIILLNILFCAALLWFFSRNAYLRPYLGSTAKEFLSGVLLLVTLYANYYVFYPKLHRKHIILYWIIVAVVSLVAGCAEFAAGYSYFVKCQAVRINEIGLFKCISKHLLLVFGRNFAFNFFPYMLRERKHLRHSLETEVQVVYQYARMIDVCDEKNNCRHIPVEDVFYCKKVGNYVYVYTVDGDVFTRYCSIKYMEQFLGSTEFIRISPSIIVPFLHIVSCDGKNVILNKMTWQQEPLAFSLDIKKNSMMADIIKAHLVADQPPTENIQPENIREKDKKNLSVPPKDKLDAVINYIQAHPGCQAKEIIAHSSYSKTTMDRCLLHLKQQGLIEHTGSKKTGGYKAVNNPPEEKDEPTTNS